MSLAIFVTLCVATSHAQSNSIKEVEVKTEGRAANRIVYKMTVSPAAAPKPLLRYRMTVPIDELIPGNAASHYQRSLAEHSLYAPLRRAEKEFGRDRFYSFIQDLALEDIPREDLRKASGYFEDYVTRYIAPATRTHRCDWGYGEAFLSGDDYLTFPLPFAQTTRSIGRVLVLQARHATAERDYDKAADRLRMLYVLGNRVGDIKILVCSLIGIAEHGMANRAMLDLMSAPDSPNMYWALASLPSPIVDFPSALRADLTLGPRLLDLQNVEGLGLSNEEWNRRLRDVTARLMQGLGNGEPAKEPSLSESLLATGLVMSRYEAAKERLLDGGMGKRLVEDMAIGQAVLIDAAREYRRIADELEVIAYLPPPEVAERWKQSDELFHPEGTKSLGVMMAEQILPASAACSNAVTRINEEIAALRVIEAIRMHAAETGALPKSLDDIHCVHVPRNLSLIHI